MQLNFDVEGMSCAACQSHVEKAVYGCIGVNRAEVYLLQKQMTVDFDPNIISPEDICKAVDHAGYKASLHTDESSSGLTKETRKFHNILITCMVLWIGTMLLSMTNMFGLQLLPNKLLMITIELISTMAIVILRREFFSKGFPALLRGTPTMDTLVALGASAAILYSLINYIKLISVKSDLGGFYFDSAATILTLVSLGKYWEAKGKDQTSEAIKKLFDLMPNSAIRISDGKETSVPLEEIQVGDVVVVKAGNAVPLDGVVLTGSGYINESSLTGESYPRKVQSGDKVWGSTICQNGYLSVEIEKIGAETVLSQMINLVEEAGASKAPIQKTADKVSAVFVPIVLGIAVLTTVVWLLSGYDLGFSLLRGIAVLVISCPCSLGLATPTAIMVGTGRGSELGILHKNASVMETMAGIDTVVFDKTGTITEGYPAVSFAKEFSPGFMELACQLEQYSDHPLSKAILSYGKGETVQKEKFSEIRQLSGKGIIAEDERGNCYWGGNSRLLEEYSEMSSQQAELKKIRNKNGETVLFFGVNGTVLGMFGIKDRLKPTSRSAVQYLEKLHIKTLLLSGDQRKPTEMIAKELGIQNVISEVLPHEKEKVVKEIQKRQNRVAMVGDGINDAPSLTVADVGFAVGSGSDISIDCADVVLLKNDMMSVPTAIDLSRKTFRIIRENLFWAFFYNCIGVPIAAGILYPVCGVLLSPMIASITMSLSSVTVVSNALRLKKWKPMEIGKSDDVYCWIFNIEGMMCEHCVTRVKNTLEKHPGVSAAVSLEQKTATVRSHGIVTKEELMASIEEAGYHVTIQE